jgi:ATP sulfurylase|tara:strand:+ start:415 stop:651 length:237 start_codon:yes stop_codon:yes gene_type:complete
MKESTLVEMQKKIDSLIRVSQKLILEIQQIDSLSRGTITALQLFMGEKEWSKIVDKMKKAEEKRNKKEQEKKLDLNVE